MRLDADWIRGECVRREISLQALLHEAGVSRTAYYSLVRKDSVLPRSVCSLAGTLGVRPSALLVEAGPEEWRARAMLRKAQRIVKHNPGMSFENVWHTLVLLEEDPVERLRRSLLRGRALDLH
jgi:hypothetical protein